MGFIGVTDISRLLGLFPGGLLLTLIVCVGSTDRRGKAGWEQQRCSPVLVDVLKGLGVVNGKDAQESFPCSHVLVSHGTVLLLSCRIQDVQQTCLSIDDDLLSVGILPRDREKVSQEASWKAILLHVRSAAGCWEGFWHLILQLRALHAILRGWKRAYTEGGCW